MKLLITVFEKLEILLSRTQKYLSGDRPQICDYYGFPHISRFFYLKNSVMHDKYEQMSLETRFPHLYGWFCRVRLDPKLQKELIPISAFHRWVEELITLPLGKKPPLRLPMKL